MKPEKILRKLTDQLGGGGANQHYQPNQPYHSNQAYQQHPPNQGHYPQYPGYYPPQQPQQYYEGTIREIMPILRII